jgi:hypothetical protein
MAAKSAIPRVYHIAIFTDLIQRNDNEKLRGEQTVDMEKQRTPKREVR